MTLSRPTYLVFIISVIVAVLAVLAGLGKLTVIPLPSVWQMGIAYVLLAIGCLFKGA